MNKRAVRFVSLFEVSLLVIGVLAFGFILGGGFVGGELPSNLKYIGKAFSTAQGKEQAIYQNPSNPNTYYVYDSASNGGFWTTPQDLPNIAGFQDIAIHPLPPPTTAGPVGQGTVGNPGSVIEIPSSLPYSSEGFGSALSQKELEALSEDAIMDGSEGGNFESALSEGGSATPPPGPEASTGLPRLLGVHPAGFLDSLLAGAQWAVVAYFATKMVGGFIGLDKAKVDAASNAAAAGIFAGKFTAVGLQKSGWISNLAGVEQGAAWVPWGVGIGVAIAVYVLTYEDKKVKELQVNFQCMPWQAPSGVDDCEKCNDEDKPCSEYKCKSLGQACELANKGTDKEMCVYAHPKDVQPPIINPDENVLTLGHKYVNVKPLPPGPGFEIVREDKKCIKAFTPLTFGIRTDEPAQCKIDYNHTTDFLDMNYWFGGSNLYLYNHTEQFSLPGPSNLEGENLTIKNDGNWTFFIRCRDFNGNENEAEYAARFCVDPSPDTTPPVIKATSVKNNGYVPSNVDSANVEFYVNEPAQCRWSKEDKSYDTMENDMVCSNAIYEINALLLYTCTTELNGIARGGTDFFVRCKDQPGKEENDRNVNKQSYKFTLSGSTELKIKNLKPNRTVYGSVSPTKVELYVESLFGSENGKAVCYYALEDVEGSYIEFFETDDNVHTQRQDLFSGNYKYYYKCVDSAGNVARNFTSFKVDIDTAAPVVARVYEEDGMLKVVTVKQSECVYSLSDCDFSFIEGTQMPYANSTTHVADWDQDKTYYIKCRDEFRNEEADCSVIVRPSRSF